MPKIAAQRAAETAKDSAKDSVKDSANGAPDEAVLRQAVELLFFAYRDAAYMSILLP